MQTKSRTCLCDISLRQPGCLSPKGVKDLKQNGSSCEGKTRRFPPPPHSGFGFSAHLYFMDFVVVCPLLIPHEDTSLNISDI